MSAPPRRDRGPTGLGTTSADQDDVAPRAGRWRDRVSVLVSDTASSRKVKASDRSAQGMRAEGAVERVLSYVYVYVCCVRSSVRGSVRNRLLLALLKREGARLASTLMTDDSSVEPILQYPMHLLPSTESKSPYQRRPAPASTPDDASRRFFASSLMGGFLPAIAILLPHLYDHVLCAI